MEVASPLTTTAAAALVPTSLAGSNKKKRALVASSCSPGSSSSLSSSSSSSSSSSPMGTDVASRNEQPQSSAAAGGAAGAGAATASTYSRIWQPNPLGNYLNSNHVGGNHHAQHHSKRMRLLHHHRNNNDDGDNRHEQDASVDALSEKFSSHSPFFTLSQKIPEQQQGAVVGVGSSSQSVPASGGSAIDTCTMAPSRSLHPLQSSNPDCIPSVQVSSDSSTSSNTLATAAPALPTASISDPLSALPRCVEATAVVSGDAAALSPSSLRIEALQQDKIRLESELGEAKVALERSRKENGVLRRAVAIQQDRHKQTEAQLARAVRDKADADDKIRALEQMVVALRYHHWQASSSSHPHASSGGTMHDFMGGMPPRPPDVF